MKRTIAIWLLCMAFLIAVCAPLVHCQETSATLSNGAFERHLSWKDGVLTTTRIINRLSGHRYELKSDEFTLMLDEGSALPSARKMRASASSVQISPRFDAQNAVDGDMRSAWVSRQKPGDGRTEWIEVDLLEERPLVGVCIVWYAPWKVLDYTIEAPDATGWRTLARHTDDQQGNDSAGPCQTYDRFDAVRTQRFRIVISSVKPGSGNTAIYEVMPFIQGDPLPKMPRRLTNRDFVVLERRGNTFRLESRDGTLVLEVGYDLPARAPLMRKHLTLRPVKDARPLVSAIEVENLALVGPSDSASAVPRKGGVGKPIFLGDVWLGLEHPAGQQSVSKDRVHLRCHPGRPLAAEGLTSKSAVWGAAPTQEGVPDAFADYVYTLRHDASAPLRHFIVQELFMTNIPKTEAGYREFVADAIERLWKKHGVFLDALTFWLYYESRQGYFEWRKKDFPNGFAPVVKQLAEAGVRGANALGANVEGPTQIGAWFSLWGQEHLDGEWGKARRYEMASLDPKWGAFCFIAPRSHQLITGRVKELARQYKLAFMHWDFNRWDCAAPDGLDHGHLPNHPSYRERAIDAEIQLAQDLRKDVPHLFLMMGCGSYASPWLLSFYDVVFNGGGDTGIADVPSLVPKDAEITFRDIALHNLLTKEQDAGTFPTWGVWTHEPLLNHGDPASHLAARQKPPVPLVEKWEENLVMEMMRGTRIWKMHFEPKLLDEAPNGWKFLADAIRWQRANKDLALRTRWIGGDPAKREAYGYYHPATPGTRGKALVGLRNPFIAPQRLAFPVDQDFGSARIVFPYRRVLCGPLKRGDKVEVELDAYETVVVELSPESATAPSDAPFAPLPKSKVDIKGYSVRGDFVMPQRGGRLVALLEMPEPGPVKVHAAVNGRPVDVLERGWKVFWDSAKSRTAYDDARWRFFVVPLPAGQSRVEFVIEGAKGRLSAWQQAEFECSAEPAREGDFPAHPTRAGVRTVTVALP